MDMSILDNAPITTGRASARLGYDLRRRHIAAVLWTDPRRPDQAALAAALAAATGQHPAVRVAVGPAGTGPTGSGAASQGLHVDTIVTYTAVLDVRQGTAFFLARLLWLRRRAPGSAPATAALTPVGWRD